MKTATFTMTTLQQPSSTQDNSVIQHQSLNSQDSNNNLSDNSLVSLDDTDLELEKIMFEEFAHGLPSDIPMADF
ncbi:hypothetical protein [Nostoc piscinale]|uniref:hypothetical protein n=1 Tax=Nostoc piscinale TaxID=224012 RepID=UPI0039A40693